MIPIRARLDALLIDIGGTLVRQAAPGTPVSDLQVELLPDVADDLKELAGMVPLAAVTNTAVMREAEIRALLAQGGIEEFFSAVVTSVDVGHAKPHPAPLLQALDLLGGVDPQRVLMLGDDEVDRLAAEAAGCGYADGTRGLKVAVLAHLESVAGRAFLEARSLVGSPDVESAEAARRRHLTLTKPPGSLGQIEEVGIRLSGMTGQCPPADPFPAALAVFAGDHGVVNAGVTPWPSEVTGAMLANFVAGGAAVNVLARQHGVDLVVVDVGSLNPSPPGIRDRRIARGTADLSAGPAMSLTEAHLALDVGVETAQHLVDAGARCLLTGDMGIGNTTPAACLVAALTGRPAAEVTGRGTGIDDATLARKVALVEAAVRRTQGQSGVQQLAEVGGLEIAALAGFMIGGAGHRIPVVIDGVIAVGAALVAEMLAPGTRDWLIAGHLSVEPGAAVGLEHLGLTPLLDLDLRLGEGTGGLLAYPLVRSAARILAEMATFAEAAIPGSRTPETQ